MFGKIAFVLFVCVCFSSSSNVLGNFIPKLDDSSSACQLFAESGQNNTNLNSPINVITKLTKHVSTFSPLVIQNALLALFKIKNTGKILEVLGNPVTPNGGSAYGGLICGKYYVFYKVQFFQNPHLGSSYYLLDGKGAPLVARLIYFDLKYGTFEKAREHCGGVVAVDFQLDFSPVDNPLFYPVQLVIFLLRKAGSFIRLPGVLIYAWFDRLPFLNKYYGFWGSYQDLEEGKQYPCAINLVADRPIYVLSKLQFLLSFAKLQNKNGGILDNSQKPQPLKGRKVFKATKIIQKLVLF